MTWTVAVTMTAPDGTWAGDIRITDTDRKTAVTIACDIVKTILTGTDLLPLRLTITVDRIP